MMHTLAWAGTTAGALIATGTVLRWAFHRLVKIGAWTAAIVRLPEAVDDLQSTVSRLSTSVDVLSHAIGGTQHARPDPLEASL